MQLANCSCTQISCDQGIVNIEDIQDAICDLASCVNNRNNIIETEFNELNTRLTTLESIVDGLIDPESSVADIYVDLQNPAGGDGMSFTTAFNSLNQVKNAIANDPNFAGKVSANIHMRSSNPADYFELGAVGSEYTLYPTFIGYQDGGQLPVIYRNTLVNGSAVANNTEKVTMKGDFLVNLDASGVTFSARAIGNVFDRVSFDQANITIVGEPARNGAALNSVDSINSNFTFVIDEISTFIRASTPNEPCSFTSGQFEFQNGAIFDYAITGIGQDIIFRRPVGGTYPTVIVDGGTYTGEQYYRSGSSNLRINTEGGTPFPGTGFTDDPSFIEKNW